MSTRLEEIEARAKAAGVRCLCTYEQGDSECPRHPTDEDGIVLAGVVDDDSQTTREDRAWLCEQLREAIALLDGVAPAMVPSHRVRLAALLAAVNAGGKP